MMLGEHHDAITGHANGSVGAELRARGAVEGVGGEHVTKSTIRGLLTVNDPHVESLEYEPVN